MEAAEIEATRARREALASYAILGTGHEDVYDSIARDAAACFGAAMAAVSFLDDDTQWMKSRVGELSQTCPAHQSFCAYVVTHDLLLIVADAASDDRFRDFPSVVGPVQLRFYAGAPIRTPAGLAVGTLCVIDPAPRHAGLTNDQGALLGVLADKVAMHLELRRLSAAQAVLGDLGAGRSQSHGLAHGPDLGARIDLSPRQIEVLTWAAHGKSASETATILDVSTRTVRFHLAQACGRLGVSRTTAALALAVSQGLIGSSKA